MFSSKSICRVFDGAGIVEWVLGIAVDCGAGPLELAMTDDVRYSAEIEEVCVNRGNEVLDFDTSICVRGPDVYIILQSVVASE